MVDVLITGGTGFIGHWLDNVDAEILRLLNIGLHRRNKMPLLEDLDTFPINKYQYDQDGWATWNWDFIIHLAPVPVDRVIECAQRCNARILFASSGGVYDREPDEYFRMKIDDERKLLDSGLDVRIARIFTTCGAHMTWERYAIGNFIKQAAAGGPINVQSYGLVVRSYMYGSDLAEWLWKILLDGEPGGVYNVGSDVPHSTQELAHEIADHFIPRPVVNIIAKIAHEPRPFYVPDTTRAREELGLTIKVPFERAIFKTVEDWRNERR